MVGGDELVADLVADLRRIGIAAGLTAVGVAPVTPFADTRRHLEERRAAGLHGGMAFTYRNPARSTEPARIVDHAQSLVVGAYRYPSERGDVRSPANGRPRGMVARYATADHYRPLRDALAAIAGRLRTDGWRAQVVADDNALVDREAARRAGLGWYGKNTNLLLPGQGSWFVLGSVVTDAPLPVSDKVLPDGCGACRRCLPACPTGALVAPGVLDARRCLAWLLQAPGVFPVEFRKALGGRIYGCDDCQEVCPDNRPRLWAGAPAEDGSTEDGPAGDGSAGDGSAGDGAVDQSSVDLLDLLAATDDELLARFGRWYIPQRQPRYLRRNALIALGNIGDGADRSVAAALKRALADPDPVIRAHAVWSAVRLDRRDLLEALAEDPDPLVRKELDRVTVDLT